MSKRMVAALAALAVSAGGASAQEVKVGVVLPYTGVGAELAQQMDRGMELYLKLNADQVKPYTIKLIKRDSKAPNGADAKIAVQELLTQDKVDALAGWVYSPDAIASAPVVTAGKKLAVIMNAGTAFITNLSPDFVRTSFTHVACRLRHGRGGGQDAARQDRSGGLYRLPARQGQPRCVQGRLRSQRRQGDRRHPGGRRPAPVPDFTPFFQRAKDEHPDVLFVFVPAGDQPTAVVKTYGALGMRAAGIKLIGPGDITQDIKLQAMGDAAVGLITMHHYNADLDNPREQALRRRLEEGLRPELDARLHRRRRAMTAWPPSCTPCRPPRARWTARPR